MRELRKLVWRQTREAACHDLRSGVPELADPPEYTRVVVCDPSSLVGPVSYTHLRAHETSAHL
eukprot:14737651-Alexandrium_andersonii.AAC.1